VHFLLRLLALTALLLAQVGMIGGHALAMPMKAEASAHTKHCTETVPSGEDGAPSKELGSSIDCATACACVQPVGFRVVERVGAASAHAPLPSPGIVPSRNPAADPPPPRRS
jgi:hypothetical protein